MPMPKEDLRHLQEKYADLLKDGAGSVPLAENPASDKYDHEMIRPETKAMRAMRWGLGSITTIWLIYVAIFFIYGLLFKSPGSGHEKFIIISMFSPILLCLLYFSIKGTIVYRYRNRLSITDEELLICSPRMGHLAGPDPIKLRLLIHEIVDASIMNPGSPELSCIMNEDKRFKLPKNQNLYSTYLIHRSCYKYLLTVNDQPFSDDTQFVDIELLGGWRILVEFDDVKNFVSVLKRRISQKRDSNLGG